MKANFLLLIAALYCFTACNNSTQPDYSDYNEIVWHSFEEAQELSKKAPRKLLVDVYTPWCGPCKMMDRSAFSDPDVIKHVNEHYYAVKFNGESKDAINFKGQLYENPQFNNSIPKNRRNSPHQLTKEFGIRGYPTLIIFDEELKKVKDIVGFKQPSALMASLDQVK